MNKTNKEILKDFKKEFVRQPSQATFYKVPYIDYPAKDLELWLSSILEKKDAETEEAKRKTLNDCIEAFKKADVGAISNYGSAGASIIYNGAMKYFEGELAKLSKEKNE